MSKVDGGVIEFVIRKVRVAQGFAAHIREPFKYRKKESSVSRKRGNKRNSLFNMYFDESVKNFRRQ